MSTPRRCDIILANNKLHYLILGKFEGAEEDRDCNVYGPFGSFEYTEKYLNRFSNPGGFSYDDSGTQPPPKKR